MSFVNDYAPAEALPQFDCVDGVHFVSIIDAKTGQSKTNRNCLVLELSVQDSTQAFYHKIYESDSFNYYMTRVFDAFGIVRGNFNFASWKGKQAKANFAHTERTVDGKIYRNVEIKEFILPEQTNPQFQQNPQYRPIPQYQNPAIDTFDDGGCPF